MRFPARCCAFALVALAALAALAPSTWAAETEDPVDGAGQRISATLQGLQGLISTGDMVAVNHAMLAAYPTPGRAPAEAFILGNLLFRMDPVVAYELHAEAAKGLPGDVRAIFELGLEQHRRGEFAKALVSYDLVLADPDCPSQAPAFGLSACCCIELGDLKQGVDRWQKSERSRHGTLEDFESMLCEVMTLPTADQVRNGLRTKAVAGDADATVRLIEHELKWTPDWWNNGPNRAYLKADRALLAPLADARRRRFAEAAVDLALTEDPDVTQIGDILKDVAPGAAQGLVLADDPDIAGFIVTALFDAKTTTRAQVFTANRARIEERCAATRDPRWYNVRANLDQDADEVKRARELDAWNATGDVRFALGYLFTAPGEVAATDPVLLAALLKHPRDGMLQGLRMKLGKQDDPAVLADAIKAECTHLSAGGLSGVPKASRLRSYFKALSLALDK